MTPHERMLATLKKTGLPHREIKCYGSQITVLAIARGTAERWASLLARFCRKVKVIETIDYCSEAAQKTRNTISPKVVKCFLIGATI